MIDPAFAVVMVFLAVSAAAVVVHTIAGKRAARLDEQRREGAGIDGTALVTEIEAEPAPFGEPVTEFFLTLEVTLSDGERFQQRKYWHTLGPRTPQVGDRLTVRAHPDRRRDLAVVAVPFDA